MFSTVRPNANKSSLKVTVLDYLVFAGKIDSNLQNDKLLADSELVPFHKTQPKWDKRTCIVTSASAEARKFFEGRRFYQEGLEPEPSNHREKFAELLECRVERYRWFVYRSQQPDATSEEIRQAEDYRRFFALVDQAEALYREFQTFYADRESSLVGLTKMFRIRAASPISQTKAALLAEAQVDHTIADLLRQLAIVLCQIVSFPRAAYAFYETYEHVFGDYRFAIMRDAVSQAVAEAWVDPVPTCDD